MLEIFNKLKPFFEDNYKRISVREYARMQNISPPNASQLLNNLEKEGLLKKEEDRRYHFFHAKRENLTFIKFQQIYYQRKLKDPIKYIEKETINPIIILFGSFAKAEINENSDIDLAIFTITNKKLNLEKFEKKLNREIQVFTFKDRNKLNKNEELLNNILNGVILSGSW
ncbi:hypothetical protein CL616_00745 [archaeon]|nr:hypothetical protein [archaeon]|tara:strand:- start:68 stop:577 length:510 start_codon:yes stop_codon:yes gene_type:complete